jgi:hypothetical protein
MFKMDLYSVYRQGIIKADGFCSYYQNLGGGPKTACSVCHVA